MAKRKRLTPALFGGSEQALTGGRDTVRERPPIAQVAGETASAAAFAEVAGELTSAREEGRLIVKLPLDAIETQHLVRDRIAFDQEEMAALEASLRARGQQVPVEVVPLQGETADEDGAGRARYGLISGLRRVRALNSIGAGEVLAVVRRPESSAEAYLAMVEENEIRSGISFYERGRLASEAVRLGLYSDTPAAISALFSSASPAKRSKIGSFVQVHEAIGQALRFPAAIPERLGLALAGVLSRDPEAAVRIMDALASATPKDAGAERKVLEAMTASSPKPLGKRSARGKTYEVVPGISLQREKGKVVLSGRGVTQELERELTDWLAARGG